MSQIPASELTDFFLRPTLAPDATQPIRGEKPLKVESQLEAWFNEVEAAKKTDYAFELETWLRALDRFFALKEQPFSEEVLHSITVKDFTEEIKILRAGIERLGHLVSLIQSTGDVAYSRFEDFLESNINRYYGGRPKGRRLRLNNGFAEAMEILGEAIADFRVVLAEMSRLPKISFHCFLSVGRLLSRETERNGYLTYLLDRKFKSYYDRIANPYICRAIYEMEDPVLRKELARIFLEIFRLLRYLDLVGKDLQREGYLKKNLLIFILVRYELRILIRHLRDRGPSALDKTGALRDAIDSVSYGIDMEARKVYNFELRDFADSLAGDDIKVRVENSYGILKRSLQEALVTITQSLYPDVKGEDIFDTFMTRQAQSIQLRRDLSVLFEQVRSFMASREMDQSANLIRNIVDFQQASLKYLMYKDWADFDLFLNDIKRARSLPALTNVLHKFETFLASLMIEIGKRSVFLNLSLE
ncbi:MAG: hypothetical protein AB1714_15380 [Acidobacteriota bacterium]